MQVIAALQFLSVDTHETSKGLYILINLLNRFLIILQHWSESWSTILQHRVRGIPGQVDDSVYPYGQL